MDRALSFLAKCSGALWVLLAPCAGAETVNCHVGTYRLSDGGIVDIAPSVGESLRWRRFDGTSGGLTEKGDGLWSSTLGWTGRSDDKIVRLSECAARGITFDGAEGRRLTFDLTDTTFTSHGTTLVGRLVLPKGKAAVPIVVLLHGAEHDSARKFDALQRLLTTLVTVGCTAPTVTPQSRSPVVASAKLFFRNRVRSRQSDRAFAVRIEGGIGTSKVGIAPGTDLWQHAEADVAA